MPARQKLQPNPLVRTPVLGVNALRFCGLLMVICVGEQESRAAHQHISIVAAQACLHGGTFHRPTLQMPSSSAFS